MMKSVDIHTTSGIFKRVGGIYWSTELKCLVGHDDRFGTERVYPRSCPLPYYKIEDNKLPEHWTRITVSE